MCKHTVELWKFEQAQRLRRHGAIAVAKRCLYDNS